MPTVPPLSEQSARRLMAVTDAAADLVDGDGMDPSLAVAKAASAHGLPAGHVKMAVHGYNTGRAHRQLVESRDPWDRASSYPTADADRVLEHLKAAAVTPGVGAGDDRDYARGPGRAVEKSASAAPAADRLAALRAQLGVPVREAPAAVEPVADRPPAPNVYKAARDVRWAFAEAAEALLGLPPGAYATVKAASVARYPVGAGLLFPRLEKEAAFSRHAGTQGDPLVPVTHPAVALVGRIDGLVRGYRTAKAAYEASAPKPPGGFLSSLGAGWSGGNSLFRSEGKTVDGKTVRPGILGRISNSDFVRGPFGQSASEAAGAGGRVVFHGPISKVLEENAARDYRRQEVRRDLDQNRYQDSLYQTETKLPRSIDRLDEQAAVNDILADSRFKGVDPAKVLSAYSQLSSLAPSAMRNPAIAGDMINRQVQTGPLSYFDLEALTRIEKNLASAQKDRDDD